jgi:periplasmic divalent cation tolerance protein
MSPQRRRARADGGVIIVLTNFPGRDSALALARRLVEAKLAACVNVLEGCTSVYRWKSKIESGQEVPMLIKTRAELFSAVQAAICSGHPYELPEIVAVPVTAGLGEYLSWVRAQTGQ